MIENKNNSNPHSNTEKEKIDQQPLIGLFELLLEWEIKDVQEKEEKRKEVS